MGSFAELIRSENSESIDEDAVEYLEIIQRNAERLLHIVGELVELRRAWKRAWPRLELAPVSVPTVARESVR